MYDRLESYEFAENGWLYFYASPLGFDPQSGFIIFRNNELMELYKIKEFGIERTKIIEFNVNKTYPFWNKERLDLLHGKDSK